MIKDDPGFFLKLRFVRHQSATAPKDALEVLDSLPAHWAFHPWVLHHRGNCLTASDRVDEGLSCHLRACDSSPHDAIFFVHAIELAALHDEKEIVAALRTRAPDSARNYVRWELALTALDRDRPPYRDPIREFRGQPDLGGLLISEENGAESPSAAACPS